MQIMILVVGIMAFGYGVGNINLVSSAEDEEKKEGLMDTIKGTGQGSSMLSGVARIKDNPAIKEYNTNLDIAKKAVKTSTGDELIKAETDLVTLQKKGAPKGGLWSWQTGGLADAAISGFQWAAITYGMVIFLGPMLGLSDEAADALSTSAAAGAFFGKGAYTLLGEKGALSSTFLGEYAGLASFGIGLAVTWITFVMTYEEESYKVVKFSCEPWSAQTGGDYCEQCNEQDLPCSEYQCKSLGQACELLNQGTDEETCTWVNRQDVTAPVIEPNTVDLLDYYEYTPSDAVSPPDRGVEIIYTEAEDGSIPAYSAFEFGITVNEPAECKIDYERKDTYDEMQFYFGDSSGFAYNHTQIMSLPGSNNDTIELENGGNMTLYVRCQDANGNSNTADFVFLFSMNSGPDTTAVEIIDTSVSNGMPVLHNQDELILDVYTNEPAECKWSNVDESYENMDTAMTCSKSMREINSRLVYTCEATIIGIQNEQENRFYFRCEDDSGNVNAESQPVADDGSVGYVVYGTRPLIITSAAPNDTTVREASESVKVTLEAETGAGFNEGDSTCYYSDEEDGEFIEFFNTNSYTHSTDLYFLEGAYSFFIKCIDLGGNSDMVQIDFEVESDGDAPSVVRAYKEETNLRITTSEKAECVYDITNCNFLFEDGIAMTQSEEATGHFVEWSTKSKYFIKCMDEFGNKPSPNECSIIVRPIE